MKKGYLLLTLISVLSITSCNDNNQEGSSSSVESNLTTYNLTIKTLGNNRVNDVEISIYDGDNLVKKVVTDYLGNAEVEVEAKPLTVKLGNLKDGMYEKKAGYTLDGNGGDVLFHVDSRVIEKEKPKDITYKIGDIMYDFSFTDTEGNEYSLAESLKTKDLVVLNFWASWCGPCQHEFPYLNAVYRSYKEDIEMFAMSVEPTDTLDYVAEFKDAFNLKLPMGRDDNGLYETFGYRYIPATVIVNKFGIITFGEESAFPNEDSFAELIENNLKTVKKESK